MDVEFKRDMHNNYMILKKEISIEEAYYGLKMVLNNSISNLLKMELRVIDNITYYYYDITSKQSVSLVAERGQLKKEQIKKIIHGIIEGLEHSEEFLLNGNDFIIEPEYIYLDLTGYHVHLCYRPGYKKEIGLQLCHLIEYLMNKIDYKEEATVLLTYSLYKLSKSEECTFQKIKEILEEKEEIPIEKSTEREDKRTPSMVREQRDVPMMKERIESEKEVRIYSNKTWFLCILSGFMVIFFFLFLIKSDFLMNQVSGNFNINKTLVVVAVIGVMEGVILKKLLNGKNKISKLKSQTEYFDLFESDETEEKRSNNFFLSPDLEGSQDMPKREGINKSVLEEMQDSEEEIKEQGDEKTIILGRNDTERENWLRSLQSDIYKDIFLSEFPFFVGKLKTNVDSAIDNKVISRYHAKFEKKADEFYVTDLNSTNGTFVNHVRLEPSRLTPIKYNDVISFANISYYFSEN